MAKKDFLVAEKQQIKAGSDFNGAAPATNPDTKNHVLVYPAGTSGGLIQCILRQGIDPAAYSHKRIVRKLEINFGGQSTWSLSITDGTHDYIILSGTTDTSLVVTDVIYLAPSESLKLVTSGATNAMQAVALYEVSSVRMV